MYSVSNAYSKAINADTRSVLYRVTLAGAIVADQTRIPKMVITESVGDTSGVAIGTANSSTLTFTLRNADTINYNDILVEPESGLVLPDGSIEWMPLGKFWVTTFQTSNDYETVNLSCSDGMYHLTDEFVSDLTYPTDIKNVVNEFCAKTGVVFVSSLPKLEIRRKPEGMTYREVIGYLAGCCGKNARFNRLGQLEFFWYEDSGITIERRNQYLDGMTKLNDKPLEVNFEVVGKQELYAVTCITDGNGGVTATPGQNVLEGETVVLSINPFYGYELADISAVTDAGDAVTLYMNSESGRTFVQPDSNVTVTAAFRASEGGPYKLTVRTDNNGSIRANGTEYDEGSTATTYIRPNDGYEFDRFATIPAGISFSRVGTNSSGETIYDFTIPKSDVTVTVYYKQTEVEHIISARVDDSEYDNPGYLYVEDTYTGEFPLRKASAGTVVSVTYSPLEGYEFDYFDSSVALIQVGTSTYNFTMPDEDVEIVAHYKLSEDRSKTGMYSWLALPQYNTPPSDKPYWAVFYKDDWSVPTCKKFHLVWFDSWSATNYNTNGGKRVYTIRFNGYYYCGSQDTGHLPQAWDTSVWSGNGASTSTLEWDVYVDGHAWSGNSRTSPSGDYCLLASNVHLFYNSSMIFEKCEDAIRFPRTGYAVDGVDIREKGSLTYWKCPDTFSTPLPARKWMIVNADGSLCMTPNANGSGYSSSDYCNGLYILFYDDIFIENIGKVFDDSDEEFYVATVTNGHYAAMKSESSSTSWGLVDVAEGDVIGLRSPLYGCRGTSDMLGRYYFSGVLATNVDLWSSGLFMYRNDSRICDCATVTEAEPINTFALRRTRTVSDKNDTESVTITYENPLIYEKMADTVSELVQGITYTPAKVKHRGNPAFQVGDIIRTPDKNGVYHDVIIMQQTMNFGGGMNSEIVCPGQTEKAKNFSSRGSMAMATKKEVQQSNLDLERRLTANNSLVYAALYKTIGVSEAKIQSIVEWQTETNAAMTSIEQTVSGHSASIETQARMISDTAKSVTEVNQKVTETNAEIDLLAEYNGYYDVIKVDTTADMDKWNKHEIYYVESKKKYYVWTKQSFVKSYKNSIEIASSAINAKSNGNTLELTIEGEASSSGNSIAINLDNVGDFWAATNKPITSSMASIRLESNENKASIDLLVDWKSLTNETIANIVLQADEDRANIGLLVENGDVKGSVIIDAIENDESIITLSGDRLVVDSKNFKLTKDGTLTAMNGTFTGVVNATEGKIGNFVIAPPELAENAAGTVSFSGEGFSIGFRSDWTTEFFVSSFSPGMSFSTSMSFGGIECYQNVEEPYGNFDIDIVYFLAATGNGRTCRVGVNVAKGELIVERIGNS